VTSLSLFKEPGHLTVSLWIGLERNP